MKDKSGKEVIRAYIKGAPDVILTRSSAYPHPELATAKALNRLKQEKESQRKTSPVWPVETYAF